MADYCGPADEIKIEVLNFTSRPVTVRRGDRLAQGVILPFVRADWQEVGDDRSSNPRRIRRHGDMKNLRQPFLA